MPAPHSHNGSCRCLSALSWQSIDQSKFQAATLTCYHARDVNRYFRIKAPMELHYWCSPPCIVRCQLRQTNIVLPMRNSIKKSQNLKVIFFAVLVPKNLSRFEWQPIRKYITIMKFGLNLRTDMTKKMTFNLSYSLVISHL